MTDTPTLSTFETGAGDWVEANGRRRGLQLTPFQRLAVNVLVKGLGTGPWNISVNWEKVDWNFGDGVCFVVSGSAASLSTWDFDRLTRLVIAAHDAAVRLHIEPATFRHLRIIIHPRQRVADAIHDRHPTIEQAITRFRA